MNSIAEKLIEEYTQIKKFEWGSSDHNPPAGLDPLGKTTDDVFILYHLRRYLRLKMYPKLWTNLKGEWKQEHFDLLFQLIELNWARIVLHPLLYSYVSLYRVISQPATDPAQIERISKLLQNLRVKQDQISSEDWVDILSGLSSYCTTAENNGLRHYVSLAFSTRLLLIEHKYGAKWNKAQMSYLPATLFFNTIKQGLEVQDKFLWHKLELDFIPGAERHRGVHDWLRLFSVHYRNRLDPSIEPVLVNYSESLICFDEQDYPGAFQALGKVDLKVNEIINISARILLLQVLYMLATYPPTKTGVLERQFISQSGREVRNLNRVLDYLDLEKDKYPAKRVAAFRGWVKGYSILCNLYSTIVTKGNGPTLEVRKKLLADKRKQLPQSYRDLNHPRKDWLEAAFERLLRTGKG